MSEKRKDVKNEKTHGSAGPIRNGSDEKKMKDEKWKKLQKENPLVLIDDLQQENALLKQQLQQQEQRIQGLSMQLQRMITRVNRLEMYQNDMDVYLRNHQHQPDQHGFQSDLEALK